MYYSVSKTYFTVHWSFPIAIALCFLILQQNLGNLIWQICHLPNRLANNEHKEAMWGEGAMVFSWNSHDLDWHSHRSAFSEFPFRFLVLSSFSLFHPLTLQNLRMLSLITTYLSTVSFTYQNPNFLVFKVVAWLPLLAGPPVSSCGQLLACVVELHPTDGWLIPTYFSSISTVDTRIQVCLESNGRRERPGK